MLKRLFLLFLLGACLTGTACAADGPPPEGNMAALADTGFRISVPEGWTISTQPDWGRAVAEANSADGSARILAFLSRQKGWTLDDWQAALTKGSRTNNMTDIAGFSVEGRPWVGYRLTIGETGVYAAATAIGDELFLTVEFRALRGDRPEAALPAGAIDACLASLTREP